MTKSWRWGVIGFLAIFAIYVAVVVTPFFTRDYMFSGDGYHLWSFWYVILHSIREFGELPWWDPMAYNGFPLYYHFLSGWFNILDPYYAPLLLLFRVLPESISINDYYVFAIAVYPAFLNSLAVYLVARQIVRNKIIAFCAPAAFLFSQFTVLAFHDPFAYQAITGALFLIYGIIKFERYPDKTGLLGLVFWLAMFIAGLHFGTLMSTMFWLSGFILIFYVTSKRFREGLCRSAGEAFGNSRAGFTTILALAVLFLSLFAVWAPVSENTERVLRYRGEAIHESQVGDSLATTLWSPEVERISRVGLTWAPFKGLYDNIADRATRLENGHDYRYVGIFTAIFAIAALLFARNAPLVISFLVTFLLVNGFFVLTSENLLYEFLRAHSDLISSIRNTQTILPRGGASLMLIFLAIIGIDSLARKERRRVVSNLRVLWCSGIIAGSLLLVVMILYLKIVNPVNNGHLIESGAHIALYALAFSAAGLGLLFSVRPSFRSAWVVGIVVLVLFDGISSLSSRMGGELSEGRVWPHQWDARIPYHELQRRGMILSDELMLKPFENPGEAMFPISYRSGAYHNSNEVNSAFRDWLLAYGLDKDRTLLMNWDDSTNSVKRYPYLLQARVPCVVNIELSITEAISLSPGKIFIETIDSEKSDGLSTEDCGAERLIPDNISMTYNELRFDVYQEEPAFLMFVDNNDRFWSASVDDQEVAVFKTNALYKGIQLPGGKSTVVWRYDPWVIRYLRYAALFALLLLGTVVVIAGREARYRNEWR